MSNKRNFLPPLIMHGWRTSTLRVWIGLDYANFSCTTDHNPSQRRTSPFVRWRTLVHHELPVHMHQPHDISIPTRTHHIIITSTGPFFFFGKEKVSNQSQDTICFPLLHRNASILGYIATSLWHDLSPGTGGEDKNRMAHPVRKRRIPVCLG